MDLSSVYQLLVFSVDGGHLYKLSIIDKEIVCTLASKHDLVTCGNDFISCGND